MCICAYTLKWYKTLKDNSDYQNIMDAFNFFLFVFLNLNKK